MIEFSDDIKIRGLSGRGYVPPPLKIEESEFADMYFEGYTINHGSEPFYMGTVKCDVGDRVVAGPDILKNLNINPRACEPSSSPTQAPTSGYVKNGDKFIME